jgi:hypothetical protein
MRRFERERTGWRDAAGCPGPRPRRTSELLLGSRYGRTRRCGTPSSRPGGKHGLTPRWWAESLPCG